MQLQWLDLNQLLDKVDCHDVLVLSMRVTISDTACDLCIVIDHELSLAAHVTAPMYLVHDCRLLSDFGRRPCCPIPITCENCSWCEHITNLVIWVSRPPVLDCGMTFHPDYDRWDCPTPSDKFWNLIFSATGALRDSSEFTVAIHMNLSIYHQSF